MAIDVDQFYGIEIEEFPAQIAQVALWLMDHQMNLRVAEQFGEYFARLPLTKAPTIVHGNALRIDWKEVVKPEDLSYILGNPPFIGAKLMTAEQRDALLAVAGKVKGAGLLDFVSGWYLKAVHYVANWHIRIAFVSTNSITQGEQVGVLWGEVLARGFHIQFAHRTFRWNNEARGVAAVHCVIVGFGHDEVKPRRLFDYATLQADPHELAASNINPYLVDAPDALLPNRSEPLCNVPSIGIGNKPIDGGNYLFTTAERDKFIAAEPASEKWFRRWLGSDEFINGWERWCLWLGDCPPEALRQMPLALARVEAVRAFRQASKSAPTRKLAGTPTRFHVENIPTTSYLVIPEVSSERRAFIPIGFMQPDTLCSNLVKIVPKATHFHFGVLTSTMHMAWVRAVCGRLKSDYRYSAGIVYNNFPWPDLQDTTSTVRTERSRPQDGEVEVSPQHPSTSAADAPYAQDERSARLREAIERAAQAVLDARAAFPDSSLADLYDPLSMPSTLAKAHQTLDRAVDAAYIAAEKAAGRKPPRLGSDAERVAFLFERYQQLTSLLPAAKSKATRRRITARTPE